MTMKIAFSIPPTKTTSRLFVREGRRRNKIICLELQRCCPVSLKPQTDSRLFFGPSHPHARLPWNSSFSRTNSSTWSSLISTLENSEKPQCHVKDLAASSAKPRHTHGFQAPVEVIALTRSFPAFGSWMSEPLHSPDIPLTVETLHLAHSHRHTHTPTHTHTHSVLRLTFLHPHNHIHSLNTHTFSHTHMPSILTLTTLTHIFSLSHTQHN